MSTLRIAETVRIEAPPETVWRWLVEPERVAECLPGATLEGREGDTLTGSVRLSVGPVTVAYAGRAELVEQDDAARRMRMTATGREQKGAGGVRMSMTGEVAAADAGSELRVEAEVQLSGTVVRFGRGMIERVSQQLFREFADCLAARVAAGDEGPAATSPMHASGEAASGAGHPEPRRPRSVRVVPAVLRALRDAVASLVRRFAGRG